MSITIGELQKKITLQLQEITTPEEARHMARLLLMHHLNTSSTSLIINIKQQIEPNTELKIEHDLLRLINQEPIQYVLGVAHFYGLDFYVDSSVLIPRPETEELVDLIIRENGSEKLSILDIGTGSGCIAISLKYNIINADITAWDISDVALITAKRNAEKAGVNVNFEKVDILSPNTPNGNYDIIVSNPPYICHKEKELMHSNVFDHEPHSALFVPDDDPLLFYRTITRKANILLKDNGVIYFEINEAYGKETVEMMHNFGFNAVIIRDLQEKERMIKAVRIKTHQD